VSLDEYLHGRDERQLLQERMRNEGRLPPGQAATIKWPVLHAGAPPRFDPDTWDFKIGGLVANPLTFSYAEWRELPRATVVSDFHCVTRWSTFDNRWEGVALRPLLARAQPRPEATHVMVLGHMNAERYGYSTNLALGDLERDDVLFAERRNGEALSADHGGPLRLVVPHLYAWKSAKWVRGLILMDADRAGYWERLGYHMRGEPFAEERFAPE